MASGQRWRNAGRRAACALAGVVVLVGATAFAQDAKGLPSNYVCTGNEPSWKLEVAGNIATWSAAGPSAEERRYRGELASVPATATPFVVFRGRLDAGLREIVAVISQEACKDTMATEGPTKGEFAFAARVSLPQGDARTGCCRPSGPDAAYVAPAAAPTPIARVTGTVSYRARIALPPDAVLKVALLDAARADAEAVPISEVSLSRPGQVPIAFELPYATARINPKRAYVVRATIEQAGEAKWTSTRTYAVITNDRPSKVDIVVDMVKPTP